MNVFLVEAGKLFQLESGILSRRVCDLQGQLANIADIPIDKQVILSKDGKALDSSMPLLQYGNNFPVDNPLFLFSKSNIECNSLPPHITLPRDNSFSDRLDKYSAETPSCDILKFGADLADDYRKYSDSILAQTEELVRDQQLQRNGWKAVIKNLDQVASGFDKRVKTFQELYSSFIANKDKYQNMLTQFESDVKILSKIPLVKGITDMLNDDNLMDSIRCAKQQGLGITESMRGPDPGSSPGTPEVGQQQQQQPLSIKRETDFISLLDWVEAQDAHNSLNSLVLQCSRAMDQVNQCFLPKVHEDVDKVSQSLNAPGMRDIKGLEERLAQLHQLLQRMVTIKGEQNARANTIRNQQESFMKSGDVSVLQELYTTHKELLNALHTNNRNLFEFYNKFSIAKNELSQNLLIRLTWVTHCQKTIWTCDGRFTMLAENLIRVQRRFQILEQINLAPSLYCKCLKEVYRRGSFSSKYKGSIKDILEKMEKTRINECQLREDFNLAIKGHFLTALFKALDSSPPLFASPDATTFDTKLFDVTEDELQQMSQLFPEFSKVLTLPLPSSCTEDQDSASSNENIDDAKTSTNTITEIQTKNDEIELQIEKNIKLELELTQANDVNTINTKEIEELTSVNKNLEKVVSELRKELEQKEDERKTVEKKMEESMIECKAFQNIACEKDVKYSTLQESYEKIKLEFRTERTRLNAQITELKGKVEEYATSVKEKNAKIDDLEKLLDENISAIESNKNQNEHHRKQLDNLREEIEKVKDKEKLEEVEKVRTEKDTVISELTQKYKESYAELEETRKKQFADLNGTNEQLQSRISNLLNELDKAKEDVELERDTTAMLRSEAERDLKLQIQRSKDDMMKLRKNLEGRESDLLNQIDSLKADIESLKCDRQPIAGTINSYGGGGTSVEALESTIRMNEELIAKLRDTENRAIKTCMARFSPGDTVLFYYNWNRNNYLVASMVANDFEYVLHPDNLPALGLSLEEPGPKQRPWCFGIIRSKEFCQARKVNNRFNVPEGTRFYRVYARPLTDQYHIQSGPST